MDKRKYEKILRQVEKPARYIGGEKNSIVNDFDNTDVRFAFCFPDVYEVGMSHLGMQILYFMTNKEENLLCERFFAPWVDMESKMREEDIKLFSLENKRELNEFDVIGFTLQYEMSYTNILNMLDLGGVEIFSKNRKDSDPIVVAGGPNAYNPEPLSDFIDLFIIGEGEEINIELLNLYNSIKKDGFSREKYLIEASKMEGIYIPSFYEVEYYENGRIKSYNKKYDHLPNRVKKRYVSNFNETFKLENLIVPYIETIHQRSVVELFRGCTQGCRFCEAGYIYRPIRERSVKTIKNMTDLQLSNTGYNEISLSSLSSCDYRNLNELVDVLIDENIDNMTRISLPSLRVDSVSTDVLKKIEEVKKTGITLAPEAGSQRMRDIINKNITEEQYRETLSSLFKEGWSKIKLYFMIGLPFEEEEDLDGIVSLGEIAKRLFFDRPKEEIKGNFSVTLSTSCFVPKPFTPFQWMKQNSIEEFKEKIYHIKNQINDKKIIYNYHDPETSVIEGLIARGDRKIGEVIYNAFKLGAKFDGWSEFFKYDIWVKALEMTGLTFEDYNHRQWSVDEILPWDIIDPLVSKKYLLSELEKSEKGLTTRDCRNDCNRCGIENCEMWVEFR